MLIFHAGVVKDVLLVVKRATNGETLRGPMKGQRILRLICHGGNILLVAVPHSSNSWRLCKRQFRIQCALEKREIVNSDYGER